MSYRLVVTISKDHKEWLEEETKRRGVANIQDTARQILADAYKEQQQKSRQEQEVLRKG